MDSESQRGATRRVIKRYSNRKLYDTRDSRYVTLHQVGEMVRSGEDVQVIDNKSKEDKTEATLALILSEDLKAEPRRDQLGALRSLLQERGERLLSSLREGPIGRLIPGNPERPANHEAGTRIDDAGPIAATEASPEPVASEPPRAADAEGSERGASKSRLDELVESSRQTLDQLQAALDERVKSVVPTLGPLHGLRAELATLERRIAAIERHLGLPEGGGPAGPPEP